MQPSSSSTLAIGVSTTLVGSLYGNLYIIDMKVITNEHAKIAIINHFPSKGEDPPPIALAAHMFISSTDLTTWHRCLSHLNANAVYMMYAKNMVTEMDITQGTALVTPCELCLKGKQTCAEIHKTTETQADVILGCIFSDICSHMTKSHKNYKYFVTWIDDKFRKVFINGIKLKSKVVDRLKTFVDCAEVKMNHCVISLHSNGGGKYIAGIL
jgi:hypothetical protein